MQFVARFGVRRAFAGGFGRRESYAAVLTGSENLSKNLIGSVDEGRRGTEICGQGNEVEHQWIVVGNFHPKIAHAVKELGVCVAEKINRLHGVADGEAGAAFALGPCGDKAGKQLMLAAAGVLKLIDQQVADSVCHDERGVGG